MTICIREISWPLNHDSIYMVSWVNRGMPGSYSYFGCPGCRKPPWCQDRTCPFVPWPGRSGEPAHRSVQCTDTAKQPNRCEKPLVFATRRTGTVLNVYQTHLRPLVFGVDVAEHGQGERGGLTRPRLGLGDQVLMSGSVTKTCRPGKQERSLQRIKKRSCLIKLK